MHKDQHFLVDENYLKKICDYSKIKKDEKILEIGAGSGNLTEKILEREAFVYAVEKDLFLCKKLEERFFPKNKKNLRIIQKDALKIKFPECDKIISSLPYSISRKITEKILMHKFELAILVYQKEFAKKLIANVNSENYKFVSVLAQSCAEIEILDFIPNKAFDPKPQVVSAIVKVSQKWKADTEYIKFLHSLFDHRNKKVKYSIKNEKIPKGLENLIEKRPFELSPEEIKSLYQKIYLKK